MINDSGQVLFNATLTDGRGVLLVATPKPRTRGRGTLQIRPRPWVRFPVVSAPAFPPAGGTPILRHSEMSDHVQASAAAALFPRAVPAPRLSRIILTDFTGLACGFAGAKNTVIGMRRPSEA